MKVMLLASGTGSRMVLDLPKHLLPVAGEPVIARTVRQLKECGVAPEDLWLVTKNEAIRAACPGVNVFELPEQTRCVSETFYRTLSLWRRDNNVLIVLGDVMFTDAAVRKILEPSKHLCLWYTDTQDIFAVNIHRHAYPCVVRAAKKVFKARELENEGRLWNTFFGCKEAHKHQCLIDDETQDFDDVDDYNNWLSGITKNKLLAAKAQ